MQIEIIRMVQQFSNPALDAAMECFTVFAEPMVLAAVFCAVYWCLNKRFGRYLALALGVTLCVNGILKDIFRVERMFNRPGFDKAGIVSHRVETATGYSFPSGHTQTAATFIGGFFILEKKTAVRVLLAALVFTIGFSRIYLGVHYPLDVLGGLIFGAAVAALIHHITIVRENRALTVLVCLAAAVLAFLTGVSDNTFTGGGLLLGVLFGTLFEEKFVRFEIDEKPLLRMALRYALGMAFVAAAYLLPKALLPDTLPVNAARYAFIAFSITGLYPYIFTKLRF